ncbi:MAG: TIGR00730 family Rossman fold protein [Limisphaerales bacterium]
MGKAAALPYHEKMKRIAVYCGSNRGVRPEYLAAAETLGALLAREKIELVYGGGMVGLMGIVADAALQNGGHVIGVIPEKLVIKEVVHEKLPDLRVVKNMHERKALMAELSDGFIALPAATARSRNFSKCSHGVSLPAEHRWILRPSHGVSRPRGGAKASSARNIAN